MKVNIVNINATTTPYISLTAMKVIILNIIVNIKTIIYEIKYMIIFKFLNAIFLFIFYKK